jgi:hypothetical protein
MRQLELLPQREKRSRKAMVAAEPRRFVSFGGGVQSTALLLLVRDQPDRVVAAMGGLPEVAFFADTGAEPEEVYFHIRAFSEVASIPIEIIKKPGKTLEETMLSKEGSRFLPIPAFTKDPVTGKVGIIRRQCTQEYKIRPLQRAMRQRLGYGKRRIPHGSIHAWIGISTDEAGRVKDSGTPTIINKYPLLELGISREDCKQIINDAGFNPVKSRCYFCPFINDWASFKREHPSAFEKAVKMDLAIRNATQAGVAHPAYLHRSCTPLNGSSEAPPGPLEELWEDHGFEDECFGVCGV